MRLVSYLLPLPGLLAVAVALLAQPSSSELVLWCTAYWWLLFAAGAMLHYLLRFTAWLVDRSTV
jgi:hypothetical protein